MSQPFVNPDSPNETPKGLRFGLLDIMTLVTACAIALWSYDLTVVFDTIMTPESNIWKAVFRCNHLVQQTLSLTGLLLLFQAIFMKRSRLRHPGRWILYSFGVYSMVAITSSYFLDLPKGGSFHDFLSIPIPLVHLLESVERIMLAMIFAGAFEFLFYLIATTRVRGRWRNVFLCLTALTALKLYMAWVVQTSFTELAQRNPEVTATFTHLSTAGTLMTAGVAILVVYCCIADRKRRDWKHWLGVILLIQSWYATKALTFLGQLLTS